MSEAVYALVENGAVVEYPVLAVHILNRAHSVDWYREVIFRQKPTLPEFSCYEETLSVEGNSVYANYTVRSYTLEEMLSLYVFKDAGLDFYEKAQAPTVTVADVDPAVLTKVSKLIEARCQAMLDEFVQSKTYDNLVACILYAATSEDPGFVADGKRAAALRDAMWRQLYAYQTQVLSGSLPLPRSFEEIKPYLPALSW